MILTQITWYIQTMISKPLLKWLWLNSNFGIGWSNKQLFEVTLDNWVTLDTLAWLDSKPFQRPPEEYTSIMLAWISSKDLYFVITTFRINQ